MSSKERVGNMLSTPLECPSQELGDWTASVYFPGIRWLEIAWLEGLRESSLTQYIEWGFRVHPNLDIMHPLYVFV